MLENDNVYGLAVQTIPAGRDVLFLVTGGAAHVGAVATAYRQEGNVHTMLQTVPSHREGELAAAFARRAAEALDCTVTVVAGIHIDHATRDDIARIVAEAERLMSGELQALVLRKQNREHQA